MKTNREVVAVFKSVLDGWDRPTFPTPGRMDIIGVEFYQDTTGKWIGSHRGHKLVLADGGSFGVRWIASDKQGAFHSTGSADNLSDALSAALRSIR